MSAVTISHQRLKENKYYLGKALERTVVNNR